MTNTILRLPAIKTSTGLSRSTIYLRIQQGMFSRPVTLGGRAVGWPATEVAALNAARIAGRSNSEIRDLVAQLESARQPVVERSAYPANPIVVDRQDGGSVGRESRQ